MFNPVTPYGYLLLNVYLFMADIANPDLFVCVFVGPGFVWTSLTFVMNCANHLAGPHGRLAPKKRKSAVIATIDKLLVTPQKYQFNM